MNKKLALVVGVLGFVIMVYGTFRAVVLRAIPWYFYFSLGGALFLGWINYLLGNRSLFWEIEKKKILVFKTYLYYFIFGIMIEFLGRYLFGLWEYPHFDFYQQILFVWLLGYTIPLFFIYETFVFIRGLAKSFGFSFVLTSLVSSFLHEIPNTFVFEWMYEIPFISLEVFGINIVVVLGWSILVLVPLIVRIAVEKN